MNGLMDKDFSPYWRDENKLEAIFRLVRGLFFCALECTGLRQKTKNKKQKTKNKKQKTKNKKQKTKNKKQK